MKVTVLGSGTSTGVPMPACACAVCRSENLRNKRLRTSIFLEIPPRIDSPSVQPAVDSHQTFNLLVDTSPDLREQSLRYGIKRVDAVLYTHSHADHIFGLDDLRSFNFVNNSAISVYGFCDTISKITQTFDYAFNPNPEYEGGAAPNLIANTVVEYEQLHFSSAQLTPLPASHGSSTVLGFRIGNFAYFTDCNFIPEKTREHLFGLEVLIIDGLRERPHKTHFTFNQAVAEIERIKPKKAYIIHISHDAEHENINAKLKSLSTIEVELAYDGLEIDF